MADGNVVGSFLKKVDDAQRGIVGTSVPDTSKVRGIFHSVQQFCCPNCEGSKIGKISGDSYFCAKCETLMESVGKPKTIKNASITVWPKKSPGHEARGTK